MQCLAAQPSSREADGVEAIPTVREGFAAVIWDGDRRVKPKGG